MNQLNILIFALLSILILGSCKTSKIIQTNGTASDITTHNSPSLDFLPGLRKARIEDMEGKSMELDGESIPVYLLEGKRVRGMEMIDLLMEGNHIPEPYVNDNSEVMAYVLRRTTEEEKKEMLAIAKSMASQSESKLVGTEARPFTVNDMSGNEYSLEELKDKVVVINFWFIACKPCQIEIPELNELVKKYSDEDVIFIALTIDKKKDLEEFLDENPFLYNIIPESQNTIYDYGVFSFPTHIVINKSSVVELELSGLGPTTIKDIDEKIRELLE